MEISRMVIARKRRYSLIGMARHERGDVGASLGPHSFAPTQLSILTYRTAVVVLAAFLVLSGVSKLYSTSDFALVLLPSIGSLGLSIAVGVLISLSELLVAFALLGNATQRLASWVALGMILFYTIVAATLKSKGLLTQCSCFGSLLPGHINTGFYIRNAFLIALAGYVGLFLSRSNEQTARIKEHTTWMHRIIPITLAVSVLLVGMAISTMILRG